MALGILWLSTVPPTNSIVAHIFGVRYLAMLSGFTFFSHQIGSFLGAWLGGKLYDVTGSYNIVWYIVDRARRHRGAHQPADRRTRDPPRAGGEPRRPEQRRRADARLRAAAIGNRRADRA